MSLSCPTDTSRRLLLLITFLQTKSGGYRWSLQKKRTKALTRGLTEQVDTFTDTEFQGKIRAAKVEKGEATVNILPKHLPR